MTAPPIVTLSPHAQPTVGLTLVPGWNRLASDIGAYTERGVDAVQFRTARGGYYTIKVQFAEKVWGPFSGYLAPRAILTVRADSPAPTLGLIRPLGGDHASAGGEGISACGTKGSLHDHDGMISRCPIGLFSMADGNLRDAKSVPVAGYYRITRGWNKVQTLPEYVSNATTSPYDDNRVALDATGCPDAALRSLVLAQQAPDGQHLIRAFTRALMLDDPFVRSDLRALLRDAEVAWDAAREASIVSGPRGAGSAECGREAAWVAYLAATVERLDAPVGRWLGNLTGSSFSSRMRRIYAHVQSPCGLTQRLAFGSFWGSPDPWGVPPGGSGVPQSTDVAQDLETYSTIVALAALGLKNEALSLCRTVLTSPTAKWIACSGGQAIGYHGVAADQAWPAIAVWLRLDRRAALACVTRWKIPTNSGAWNGPYATVPEVRAALDAWSDKGKCAWAETELAK